MVNIKDFNPLKYNSKLLKKLNIQYKDVICPPYDVISEELYKELKERKYNFVNFELPNLILNKSYSSAKKRLLQWLKNKILVKEKDLSFYVYEHKFKDPSKLTNSKAKEYRRLGLFALTEIDLSNKKILPHEMVRPKPIEDRLNHLKTLGIQTSPVFLVVKDDEKYLSKLLEKVVETFKSEISFTDYTGDSHRLFKVKDAKLLNKIKKYFENKSLFIADGHHRYRTACEFYKYLENTKSDEKKLESAKYFFSYICPLSDNGLLILPTHRAVRGEYVKCNIDKYFNLIFWNGKDPVDIICYHKGEFKVMKLKDERIRKQKNISNISYTLLNETVLKDVSKDQIFYHQDMQQALQWADKYNGFAFLMQPVSKDLFVKMVAKGQVFPPKTTYFYPKVSAGLLAYDLSNMS